MMKRLRFLMIGGFLGAGKTTTIARLAHHYTAQGLRVGIVTNDQAAELVDTTNLRSQGLTVEEVAGACFCCRFEDLVERVGRLEENSRPDLILAEPVGSCTDLVATVVQPLRDLYGDRFEVAPYPVLFKPRHGLEILQGGTGTGFSPKAAYIFTKQLEEADAIIVNRLDELSGEGMSQLKKLLDEAYPGVPVVWMSARTGSGFEGLTALLDQQGAFGRKILDIDYDTYAEGEAELGWLNGTARLDAAKPFGVDEILLEVVGGLRERLRQQGGEVAHLKAIGMAELSFAVANLVSTASEPELSMPSRAQTKEMELIVNARVAIAPEELDRLVHEVVAAVCTRQQVNCSFGKTQSFRPGRPTPTHRYATARA